MSNKKKTIKNNIKYNLNVKDTYLCTCIIHILILQISPEYTMYISARLNDYRNRIRQKKIYIYSVRNSDLLQ